MLQQQVQQQEIKMKLVHSTYELRDVKKILEQGLKSPKETKNSEYAHTSSSQVVCFTALEKKRIECDSYGCWGEYHFVLNPEWVRENIEQFREHGEKNSEEQFFEFTRKLRMQSYEGQGHKYADATWNQILSLKPVPIEGIEALVVPSSELVFLDFEIPKNIQLRTYTKRTD